MKLRTILISLAAALVACDDPSHNTTTTTSPSTTTEDTSSEETSVEETETPTETVEETTTAPEIVVPTECEHETPCQDDSIQTLALKDTVNDRAITAETAPEGQFLTHVDGSAGGFNGSDGYVYAKFTREGLEAVRISDEDSLEDATWDIAFRRFVIRLNSGVSGPSCVLGATLTEGTEFGGVHTAPDVEYEAEAYFEGAGCNFVDDGSGIGGPGTVLSSYWSYVSCVAMTGKVYVLRLADGHHVKLQVESYYDPSVQADCDEGGEVSNPASAANFRVRWAYLD